MKVGILTFHNTTNYGAIFQCYSLQRYIRDLGYECEVVNYNNKTLKERYDLNPLKSKNLKEFVKRVLFYLPETKNQKSFKEFTEKYINISEEEYNEDNIIESDEKYNLFIAGSDQIWNYKLSGNDKNYFMTFTLDSRKRNSYAASFGSSIINGKKDVIELLKIQNNISVREDDAVTELKKQFPNIQQSIDPVFLIKKDSWLKFIDNKRICKKDYIFVYEVARTDKLRNFAHFLSKKYGLKILYLSKAGAKMKNVKRLYDVSPTEFLNYLYYSKYVVTSSFHGMALSIILEKEFFFDTDADKKEFGSRLESLGRISKLENRKICEDFNEMNFEVIDYNKVHKDIEHEINNSKRYLQRVLKK